MGRCRKSLSSIAFLSLASPGIMICHAKTQVPPLSYVGVGGQGTNGADGSAATDNTPGSPGLPGTGPTILGVSGNGGDGGAGASPSSPGINGASGGYGGGGGAGGDAYKVPNHTLSSKSNSYLISGGSFTGANGGDGGGGGNGGTNSSTMSPLANGGDGGKGGSGVNGGNALDVGATTLTITAGSFTGADGGSGGNGGNGGNGDPSTAQGPPSGSGPGNGGPIDGIQPAPTQSVQFVTASGVDIGLSSASNAGSGGNGGNGGSGGNGGEGIKASGSTIYIYGGQFVGGNGGGGGGGGTGGVDYTGTVYGTAGTPGFGGQVGYGIYAFNSNITLYGELSSTGSVVNTQQPFGSPSSPYTGSGTITGILEDSLSAVTITYDVTGTGGITLVQTGIGGSAAPEPSQLGILALIGLALGGLLLRARRERLMLGEISE